MIPAKAHFMVDPRLASVLGDNYRNSAQAIKELVDNAWDADAEHVAITMPEVITLDQADPGPVIIEDDGTGMTEAEVQSYYLRVARSRTHRSSNPKTVRFNRRIKGRKGIGKFAGLVVADGMSLTTRCGGRQTTLTVNKDDLAKAVEEESDLEKIDLDLAASDCPADQHGTTVTLWPLSAQKLPPCRDSLAEILYWEYGREPGFKVTINGEPLNMGALSEEVHEVRRELADGVTVILRYQVIYKPNKKKAGLHLRVNGKVSGGRQWFGLEDDPELPEKVRNCLIGEIEVEGVDATVIAADGSLFDESKVRASINKVAQEQVGGDLKQRHHKQVNLAKARIAQEIKRRIERLPEHRRAFAEQRLTKVLDKYYPEFSDRVESLVWLALQAMEQDVYWTVCQALKEADHADTTVLSNALDQFGFADMAYMLHQVHQRLEFLAHLETLARDGNTLERQMHEAIEHNPWVLGHEYELMYSEQTLQRIISDFCDKEYAGNKAAKRPDLLIWRGHLEDKLLVEFKRPSMTIGRDAEAQAKTYDDELRNDLGQFKIMVVGGKVDSNMKLDGPDYLMFKTYLRLISDARSRLRWMVKNLTQAT